MPLDPGQPMSHLGHTRKETIEVREDPNAYGQYSTNRMHPHPDKAHLVRTYRAYILAAKRQFGTARSLVHYRQIIAIYLWAKRPG